MKHNGPLGALATAILASVTLIGCAGCSGLPALPEMVEGDWTPPILQGIQATGETEVLLNFNEEVRLSSMRFEPASVTVSQSRWDEERSSLAVALTDPLEAGKEYGIDAEVSDTAGNLSSFVATFYGLNPDLPPVLINEVVCEGSSSHPDWVELRVFREGLLGGLTLYEGGPGVWDSRFVFPQIHVSADDYVVVHFKPEGIPEEVSETDDPAASGGHDVHPESWDVWVTGGDGIPNSTGGLTLTAWPGGPVVDAFLYTTKHYDADVDLRGFGLASQLEIFEDIVTRGGWQIAGTFVVPDDGFNPEDSTATRSINRSAEATDTDSAADWHIAPTSGATPGSENTNQRYEP